MAKAPAKVEHLQVVPAAPPVIHCHACVHWKPLVAQMSFGHCMLSAKALPGPIATTDMATCSKAQARA